MTTLLLVLSIFSYQMGMSGIQAPAPLNQFATEFTFQHRFYGNILDTNSTFLGMDQGANANLGLYFYPIKGLAIGVSRISEGKETHLGASYSRAFPKIFLKGRLGLDAYAYHFPGGGQYWGYFPSFTVQTEPILKRIEPFFTLCYDSYMDGFFNLAVGLSATVFKDIYYFKELALVAEYHPYSRAIGYYPEIEPKDIFLFGIGASTYGHQFLFTLSNSTDLGTREMMQGTLRHFEDEDLHLYLGFTIRRLLVRGKES